MLKTAVDQGRGLQGRSRGTDVPVGGKGEKISIWNRKGDQEEKPI